ncbi:MAG TPA: hypothetical protein VHM31_05035 [Polyangia bacterium]|nr:hypothetical protein [Polyangia bacterium]
MVDGHDQRPAGVVFESSGGRDGRLVQLGPDGAPDLAWVQLQSWRGLDHDHQRLLGCRR